MVARGARLGAALRVRAAPRVPSFVVVGAFGLALLFISLNIKQAPGTLFGRCKPGRFGELARRCCWLLMAGGAAGCVMMFQHQA